MGYQSRAAPKMAKHTFGSVATDSSEVVPLFSPANSGQILGCRFVNGITSTVASGTTAGSALNAYVYKTASSTAASAVASARLGAVATMATVAMTMTTSTALTRFVDGDVYIAELLGGIGNDTSQAGAVIQVDYMYAYTRTDTATP